MTNQSCSRRQRRGRARRAARKRKQEWDKQLNQIRSKAYPRRLVMIDTSVPCACCGKERDLFIEHIPTKVGLPSCKQCYGVSCEALLVYESRVNNCATICRRMHSAWQHSPLKFYRTRTKAVETGHYNLNPLHVKGNKALWLNGQLCVSIVFGDDLKLERPVSVTNLCYHNPDRFRNARLNLLYDTGRAESGVWHTRWRDAVAKGLALADAGVGWPTAE